MKPWKKKAEESFFKSLMVAVTCFILFSFLFIVYTIFKKGFSALSWEMISQAPKGGYYFGKGGGMLNAIAGSFYLATGAVLLAVIAGLPAALFINVHLVHRKRLVNAIRFLLDSLWGVPSIVYGAFGFTVMVFFHLRASLLAGIITVALVIVPIIIRAMDEALRTIPMGLLETAHALGSTKNEIAFKIFFRQAMPGFMTAVLLAFGRGIGDAAAVLFTTGYTDYIPVSLNDQAATLPLAIFFQLSSPIEAVRERAYAAAVILTIIILLISIGARLLSKKLNRNII